VFEEVVTLTVTDLLHADGGIFLDPSEKTTMCLGEENSYLYKIF
jgi:hypothetical protein